MNKYILIILILVLLVGGLILVKNNSNSKPTVTPTVAPTVMKKSPTETPSTMSKKEDTVTLTATGFDPKTITIKVGDKVVWLNKSGDAATVNSDPHPTHTDYPPLNLGSFNDGEKLELVFDKKGSFGYHDHLHPSRRGTVVVE